MNKKQTTKKPDVEAQLEAITGLNIDLGTTNVKLGTFNLFVLLGALSQQTDGASITWRNLTFDEFTHGSPTTLLDVSARSYTGSDGKTVFRLREFVNFTEIFATEPVHVVATPLGNVPSFLTVDHRIQSGDVEITVFSWDSSGNAAPNVAFNWRCRVPRDFSGE